MTSTLVLHASAVARASFVALVLAAGCADPVRDERADLGPEAPNVPPGPLHRAGQPCVACHDGSYGGARAFSIAGTVFAFADGEEPAPDTVVELTDARGRTHRVATNCAGNFFVEPEAFTPTFPLWVALERGTYRIEMDSAIRRDGSCASCHAEERSSRSAGRVYLFPSRAPQLETGCQ